MASNDEPVTSPDQHKPGAPKAARLGAVGTLVLLAMLAVCGHSGTQEGLVGLVFVIVCGAGIIGWLFFDWLMRKNGIKD